MGQGHDKKPPKKKRSPRERLTWALRNIQRAIADDLAIRGQELPEDLELRLDFSPTTNSEWRARAQDILDTVTDRLESVSSVVTAGRAWCFQCKSNQCAHGVPESLRQTFAGYTATGKPRWENFLDLCLKRRPAGMDGLFAERPTVVVVALSADELNEERLPEFTGGTGGAQVLGQVVLGLLPSDLNGRSKSAERRALTIQILSVGPVGRARRYMMNLIGFTRSEIRRYAADQGSNGTAERLRRIIERLSTRLGAAQQKLATLSGSDEERREAFVDRILSRLRSDIDQIFRSGQRRTKHAEARHQAGGRPTRTAWDDARGAPREKVFYDIRHETFVVVGKRGRAHVFSPDGRHVTSLRLEKGEIDRKANRGRWRPISPSEFEDLRKILVRETAETVVMAT